MSPVRIRLRELRDAQGLTQQAWAERAGVRQATVSQIESGTSRVDLDVLERLADALGKEPGELLEREPKLKRRR
jgi:transcriptional regulator with XRE-family HTH domain